MESQDSRQPDLTAPGWTRARWANQSAILQGIIDGADALIFSVDRDYRYTSFNHGHADVMRAIYGGDIQLGGSLLDYMTHAEDRATARQHIDRALQGDHLVEEAYSGEEQRTRRCFQVSHRPIHDAAGEVIGVAILAQDITERRQAEEGLHKLNAELDARVRERTVELEQAYREMQETQERMLRAEKLAALGRLAGSVSHELRNPLGAIKNAAYLLNLALEDPAPDVREMLDLLQKEVATSERIIGDLLDFARNRPPLPGRVHVNVVLADALAHVAIPASVAVVRAWDPDLPVILADAGQLGQVFINLIQNAVQAMPEGGRLTVTTDTDYTDNAEAYAAGWVVACIADTGVGIATENLDKVFEALFSTKAKGVGLGLAIAKGLVESNNGTIDVRSEVGGGSTFTVRVPALY